MSEKRAPLGICDLCGKPIHDTCYPSKGKPRLYCSRECRNTANSRAGAPIKRAKALARIASGEWQNPILLVSPEERRELARHNVARWAEIMRQQVAEGTWRNPALSAEARRKLSRPRKHEDAPLLHRAMEHMYMGLKLRELPEEERLAYNAYQRALRRRARAKQGEDNAGNQT